MPRLLICRKQWQPGFNGSTCLWARKSVAQSSTFWHRLRRIKRCAAALTSHFPLRQGVDLRCQSVLRDAPRPMSLAAIPPALSVDSGHMSGGSQERRRPLLSRRSRPERAS
jgi:hypothetical protein